MPYGRKARSSRRKRTAPAEADKLWAILHGFPVPVIVHDLHGRVILWNRGMEQLLGWSEDEVLGTHTPHIPDDLRSEYLVLLAQVINHRPVNAITTRRHKNGSRVTVHIRAKTYEIGEGEQAVLGVLLPVLPII